MNTTLLQSKRAEARVAHTIRQRVSDILAYLQEECPKDQKNHKSVNVIFRDDRTKKEVTSAFGKQGLLTELQFELLMAHANRNVRQLLNTDGHVDVQAISKDPYAALIQKYISIYVMNFGVAEGIRCLTGGLAHSLIDENKERARGIAVLLLAPQPTNKGLPESIVSVAIRKGFNIRQLTRAIELRVMREADRYLDKVERQTVVSELLKTQILEDNQYDDSDAAETKQSGLIPLALRTPNDVVTWNYRTWLIDEFMAGVNALPQEHQELIKLLLSPEAQKILSEKRSGPSPELAKQIVMLRPLTGLSVRKSRKLAQEIVSILRRVFGITGIEQIEKEVVTFKNASTRRRRMTAKTKGYREAKMVNKIIKVDKIISKETLLNTAETHYRWAMDQSGFKVKAVFTEADIATLFDMCESGFFTTENLFRRVD